MIFLSLLLAIVALNRGVFAIDVRRLFYEKDLSEYCKRRVIPSIFLGRHVVEASAYILHFTKLNLPYNCFISVRSEAGSNMIMVITLPSNSGLEHACSESRPQLLVYEMGETFGGYWGMLPEVMLKHKPPAVKYYTLKTTQPTTQPTEPSTEEYVEITSPAPTPYVDPKETQDYIRVEVPIVDVSGHFERGSQQPTKAFDFEEAFDYLYDVTPIPGVKYDTSILPLVQLSVRKQTDDGRRGYGQEPRYELDVVEEFTQDPRLKPTYNQRHRTNARTRRLSFARNKATKAQLYKNTRTTTKSNRFTKYVFPTTMRSNIKHKLDQARNSWEVLDKLMETLNNKENYENTNEDNGQLNTNDTNNKSQIAKNISNMQHNSSIYLQSNLSIYNDENFISNNKLPFTTKRTNDHLLPRTTVSSYRKRITKNNDSTLITQRKKPTTNSIQSLQSNETIPVTTSSSPSSTSKNLSEERFFEMVSQKYATTQEVSTETNFTKLLKETVPAISLVDHESWENIVQAAPSMAVLLNQSVPYNISGNGWSSLNETYRKELLERKKRAIQLIAIDSGRPHNMTTKAKTSTTTKKAFNVGDMQEFARLVELEDDNIHGRVALRYLKQYVGPPIYNICADTHISNRHIYLFNSSRIVLSLNNFTLSSLSVIITGARTLLSHELRCPNSMLECQVSGARVCVDSLAACDGVPNCGSYDIYDEDRVMCGAALGLQHNVYLAAFTFLAFILTLFYVVHYWLKQCVPKVAQAFFVYTDGTENILYLDSIMRSPGDYDDGGQICYRVNMNSGELVNEEFEHYSKPNICSRLFRRCFFCFWKKEKKVENEDKQEEEILTQGHRKTYSFTQMELSNMMARPTVETSVQTGDSLEMARFEYRSDLPITTYNKTAGYEGVNVKTKGSPMMIRDSLLTLDEPLPEDELSLMKFFRDSRSDSIESDMMQAKPRSMLDSSTGAAPGGEQEMSSIMYDDGGVRSKPGPSGVKPKSKANIKVTNRSRKRIRFDEAPTMISSPISDDSDDEEEKPSHRRQILPLGPTKTRRSQHLSAIKEDDESGNRHRHFWESKKKKSTKKGNVSSR